MLLLHSATLLLGLLPDLTFEASASKMDWKINGQAIKVLDVEVIAKGAEADLIVAVKTPAKLKRATSLEGKRLEPFISPFSGGGVNWIRGSSFQDEGQIDFKVSVLEPEKGTLGLLKLEGQIEALQAKSKLAFELPVPNASKKKRVKSAELSRAKAGLEAWVRERQAVLFDVRPGPMSKAKVEKVKLDRPFSPDGFHYWGGVGWKRGHFDCEGNRLGKGVSLNVEFKDEAGELIKVVLEDTRLNAELSLVEHEEFTRAGLEVKLQKVTVYQLLAQATGTPYVISSLTLMDGEDEADKMLASSSKNYGLTQWEWLMEETPVNRCHWAGSVFVGTRWKPLKFQIADIPVKN
jgi:hypothetical protein